MGQPVEPHCKKVLASLAAHLPATLAPEAEISILLADDAALAALNQTWRGRKGPTNVLSFPSAMPQPAQGGAHLLGDIALSWDTLAREAAAQNKDTLDHFTHLLVHGALHLLGYDHVAHDDAARMEALEVQILGDLGVADPYNENQR